MPWHLKQPLNQKLLLIIDHLRRVVRSQGFSLHYDIRRKQATKGLRATNNSWWRVVVYAKPRQLGNFKMRQIKSV